MICSGRAQGDDVSAVIQAAIVHARFETIHPFPDGNGRVGKYLIHVVLRRRGLTPSFVPPVSLVLGANAGIGDPMQLEEAGVVRRINTGRRNRAWEALGLFEIIDSAESKLRAR